MGWCFVSMDANEYIEVKKRLAKGEALIKEQGGFIKAPRKLTNHFQDLAEQTLEYEVENDLIPELL